MLEELGSDAHVFFRVDATRSPRRCSRTRKTTPTDLVVDRGALFNARVDARTTARVGGAQHLAVDPARLHFFDAKTGARSCSWRRGSAACAGRGLSLLVLTSSRTGLRCSRVTKQAEIRDQVLELIEQLAVGDAIPSERQLCTDLGVSRLTVRAALDDLVREGYLVRRRGSGTFVSEPKVAKELTITSFSDDMRQRGLRPASQTLDLRIVPAGARLGRLLHVSPSEPVLVAERLRLADGETMAIETLHVRESHVPGLTARDLEERSFYELLRDRYGIVIVGGKQTVEPTVTDEDESNALGVPLHSPAFRFERVTHSRQRRDRRVRRVDLPRRPIPPRHDALDSAGPSTARVDGRDGQRVVGSSLAWLVPTDRARALRAHASLSRHFGRKLAIDTGLTAGRHVEASRTWQIGINHLGARAATATVQDRRDRSAQMPQEMRMNVRVFAAAVLVAALAVVAVGATGASGGSSANTLTVWLQIDAQSGWPDLVAAANAQFKKEHPGVERRTSSTSSGPPICRSSTRRSPAATPPTSSRWATPR